VGPAGSRDRKLERIIVTALRAFPRSWRSFPQAMKNTLGERAWVKGIIASRLGVPARKILFTEHHQSHAAAAFLTAPTKEAAILTADGVGEWATLSVGRGVKRPDGSCALEVLRELRFPHSLGMLYSTFTAFLGFEVNEGECKVMGLASYGRPRFQEQVRAMIRRTDDGAFALDLSYFEFHASARHAYSPRLVEAFGPPRAPHEPIDLATSEGARLADVAASVQRALEDVLVDMARTLRHETGLSDLCLGGGVALNGCANALTTAQRRVLLAHPDGFTNEQYRNLNKVDRDQAYREIQELVVMGVITPEGQGRDRSRRGQGEGVPSLRAPHHHQGQWRWARSPLGEAHRGPARGYRRV
jgi:carbamoyltransferase